MTMMFVISSASQKKQQPWPKWSDFRHRRDHSRPKIIWLAVECWKAAMLPSAGIEIQWIRAFGGTEVLPAPTTFLKAQSEIDSREGG